MFKVPYLEEHIDEVKAKCTDDGIDFEKLSHCPKCWNDKSVTFVHYDPEKGEEGLMDNVPAKILMDVRGDGDQFSIWVADDIKDYL